MYNKQLAMQQIQHCLNGLGYTDNRIIQEYSVTTSGRNVLKLDMVAFSDSSLHDNTTSCISVQWCKDKTEKQKYLNEVKYIATPIMLVAEVNKVEIWNARTNKPTRIYKLSYNELYPYFQQNRFDFSFDKIVEAKQGFRQLNMFETFGLLEFAENANYRMLGEEFKTALFTGKNALDLKGINGDENFRALTSITMHVLGAIILSHKLYPNHPIQNMHILLDNFSSIYKDYFNKDYMYKFGKDTIDSIYSSLNKNILYRNINNETLGHFYESTLFGETELDKDIIRKTFGIYYTPKVLGDDILKHIPIEFIPENKRVVLDGSCGSGSLLISAYKRLEKLLDVNWSTKRKHDYLTENINGIDIDRFAREVARLSLLLYSLPNGNSWKILTRDILKIDKFDNMEYPMIIIGNPPFEETRKGLQKQKAVDFLIKYITWLKNDGYIGIILPTSFLESNSCEDARKELLSKLDILEIWSMPRKIFKNDCPTIIIIARKSKKDENCIYPTKIRILGKEKGSIKRYLENKKVDFEFFTFKQNEWIKNKKSVINFSPIEQVLEKVYGVKNIENGTEYIQGINVPTRNDNFFVSKTHKEGFSKYIQNAGDFFSAYYLDWSKQKNFKFIKYDKAMEELYPNSRLRIKYRHIYEQPKVLVKLSSTPGGFWRIVAAIDRDSCYVGHSYYCIIPKDEKVTLEEIVALINSKLINSYIGRLSIKRTLLVDAIKSIPIPIFNKNEKLDIIELVRSLEQLNKDESESKEINEIINKLDNIINKSFGLDNDDIKKLDSYYKNSLGIHEVIDKSCCCDTKMWNYIGEVIEIDSKNNVFKAIFVETNNVKTVRISGNLPGWLLRKGASFTADIPDLLLHENVWEIYNVSPLENAYMNEDDLFKYLEEKKLYEMEVIQ